MSRRGRPPYPDILTPREWEVIGLVERGYTNEEIASRIGITSRGVKFHVSEILGKLNLSNRQEAARWHRARLAPVPVWVALRDWLRATPLRAADTVAAAVVAVALAGVTVLAIAVACGDTTDDEVQGSGAVAFVRPAEGFVYIQHLEQTAWPDGRWRIAVFDADRMADAASFELAAPEGFGLIAALAGDRVIVDRGDRVASYALDGSDERVVRAAPSGGMIVDVAVSPDGNTLAVAEMSDDPCPATDLRFCEFFDDFGRIALIDLATGATLRDIPQSTPGLDQLRGWLDGMDWFGDSSALTVHAETVDTIRPDGSYYGSELAGTAIVSIDGSARSALIDDRGSDPPDGRYMLTGAELAGSCIVGGAYRIEAAIYDLETASVVASARDETRVVANTYWSPDGSQLLFSTWDADAVRPCASSPVQPDQFVAQRATEQWAVLHTDGSPTETGVDPGAVMDRWHDGRVIKYSCGDGEEASALTYCPFGRAMAWYGGQHIATTGGFVLLGWFE